MVNFTINTVKGTLQMVTNLVDFTSVRTVHSPGTEVVGRVGNVQPSGAVVASPALISSVHHS